MSNRETTTFVTPLTNMTIVHYTYLTGREYEYVQEPMLEAMAMSPNEVGEVSFGNFDTKKVREATHRMIEKVTVSVDGKTEGILDLILDMPQTDYEFVLDQLQSVNASKKK